MADSKTKTTDETDAEDRSTLPVNHPQAGYTRPDPTENRDHVGDLAPKEQEWQDKLKDQHEEETDAISEHEDEVAKQEAEDRLKQQEELQRTTSDDAKTNAPASDKSTQKSTASSSSSSS